MRPVRQVAIRCAVLLAKLDVRGIVLLVAETDVLIHVPVHVPVHALVRQKVLVAVVVMPARRHVKEDVREVVETGVKAVAQQVVKVDVADVEVAALVAAKDRALAVVKIHVKVYAQDAVASVMVRVSELVQVAAHLVLKDVEGQCFGKNI